MILSKNLQRFDSRWTALRHSPALRRRHENGIIEVDGSERILATDGANTSYSRLTIMYYRRAQPTTRGLENGYEESDEKDFSGFVEESAGEEGCGEKGAGEEGCGEEARQEGSEEEVTSLQALRPATPLWTHSGS
jgi:hypothetical protein